MFLYNKSFIFVIGHVFVGVACGLDYAMVEPTHRQQTCFVKLFFAGSLRDGGRWSSWSKQVLKHSRWYRGGTEKHDDSFLKKRKILKSGPARIIWPFALFLKLYLLLLLQAFLFITFGPSLRQRLQKNTMILEVLHLWPSEQISF